MSNRLKSIITEMDGEAHQFFPIKVLWKNGEPLEGDWHVLNVHVHVHQASIIDEKSSVEPHFEYSGLNAPIMYIRGYRKPVTLDGSRLSSLNLWREDRYPGY